MRIFELNNKYNFALNLQAQYDAGDLITQREVVSNQINEELTARAAQFGIVLDDIAIVRIYLIFSSIF